MAKRTYIAVLFYDASDRRVVLLRFYILKLATETPLDPATNHILCCRELSYLEVIQN
jgi:hypothetical protein